MDDKLNLDQGMGIHNEPGTSKLSLPNVYELVNKMLSTITDTTDKDRSFVPFKNDGTDEVILLVNGLGSVSQLEMGGITNEGGYHYILCDLSALVLILFSTLLE